METSSEESEFISVTFTEEMRHGGYHSRRYLTPKKYLRIIRRMKRLIHYHYDERYTISYSSSVTIQSEHDRGIATTIGEIHGEIFEESDIPSNSLLTEFIVDHVQSSTDDRYSGLKKRIITSEPKTLSFFTKEEFNHLLKCNLKEIISNGFLDDYIRYHFCQISL